MPRYFFSENAGRPVTAGSHRFTFELLGVMAGAVQGVLAVADEVAPVLAGKPGLLEISRESYDEAIETKRKNPKAWVTVNLDRPAVEEPRPAPRPMLPPVKPTPSGRAATVVEGTSVPVPESSENLPLAIDDAVDLGTAAPPVAEPPKAKSRKR